MEKLLYDAKIAALGYKCSSFLLALGIFPEHMEPLRSEGVKNTPFPEHVEPVENLSVPGLLESTRFFQSMWSHFFQKDLHLCLSITKSKGIMAGKLTDMSIIKQVLLLSEAGYLIRKIARSLGNVSKSTISRYLSIVREKGWKADELL